MQIYDKPLGWLTPYENNPRNNDEAVGPVAKTEYYLGKKQHRLRSTRLPVET